MKLQAFLAASALCLAAATQSQAFTISLGPDVSDLTVGETGTIQVLVDTTPENYFFDDGTLGVSIASSQPGVIDFTGATVFTPEFFGGAVERWTSGSVVNQTANGIDELLGVSVGSVGLDPAITGNQDGPGGTYLFAEIDFEVVGVGSTDLTVGEITSRSGEFIVNQGSDVSGQAVFDGATYTAIPEPASLALLALGGVALAARRRRA